MTDERDERQLAESISSSLRVLSRRPPVAAGWRPADAVRRSVIVRRRRRRGLGAAVVVAALAATAVTLLARGSSPSGGPQARPIGNVHTAARIDGAVQLVADHVPSPSRDAAATDAVVNAEQRLSLALLRAVGGNDNVSTSPASLYLALGMLQNGARGSTEREIAHALQGSGVSIAEQNAGLAALDDQLAAAAAKAGITLQSANSLWQQKGFGLRPKFLTALATYFRTGVWQADFRQDMAAALKAINAWTAQQTHGKITKLFDNLDPFTVLVLANAIYFHAAWETPFDAHDTKRGTFVTSDGRRVQAEFMNSGAGQTLRGTATADYQAVQLPYRGGRFAALAVMPTHGSLADFVKALAPAKLAAIAQGLRPASAALPRFTLTTTLHLNDTLQALGMRRAFSPTAADLSGLSAEQTYVSQVIQRVYLSVGEKGTTAAAATGIAVSISSAVAGPTVRLDHPFLFLVRDTKTGTILFAAQVSDPTAR